MTHTRFSLSALAAATLFSFAVQAAPVEIKFSHVVAENTPKGQMALKFKSLVESTMGDKYEVKVYPNSQLFGDGKELEALILGDVHFIAPSLSKFSKYTKQLQLFDLPFLFKDMEAVDRFQQGPAGQSLLRSMEKKGILGLGYLHNGLKQLSSSDPLRVPADASGKKFRIMSSDVLAAQFEAVDAVPLKKPFSEVFTLLQTRAIDGQENTWSNIYSKKFFEVQPYITESNHGVLDYLVATSAFFWSDLPAEDRQQLQAALAESIAYGNAIAIEKAQADKQAIIDSGRSKVITINESERQQWVDAMKPVWQAFEKEIGAELIQAAIESNQG
ncbi:TRAP transporter substrate-binding protein [Thaumasiovibrio subtropicus]|uniref:TRAP transporter substrate-binding protein n=1 Tax=Thaumasiovibrio subtropicus TaxID=1891207 RepID=UPI000B35011A|nr:TRAP transporter substrate-binding protein [Thaumasiovibrio subtropicus]